MVKKFTRKAKGPCGGAFMIGQGRVLSAMWTPKSGGVFFAMFENGLNFVPAQPAPLPAFKKMLAGLRAKPGVYDYRSKTADEFATLASAAGAYKKFNAAWFRKEVAFLEKQLKDCE
jgi:hypothetical protein